MVCNWSVFFQKVSIFGLPKSLFKLAIIQIDLSVFALPVYIYENFVNWVRFHCNDVKVNTLGNQIQHSIPFLSFKVVCIWSAIQTFYWTDQSYYHCLGI